MPLLEQTLLPQLFSQLQTKALKECAKKSTVLPWTLICIVPHMQVIAKISMFLKWSFLVFDFIHWNIRLKWFNCCWPLCNQFKVAVIAPIYTVFIQLHAHAQIAAHPPLSSETMHSELGVFHVIFAFFDMVVQNVDNTDNSKLNSSHVSLLYWQVRGVMD